jgi:hypothetical protein
MTTEEPDIAETISLTLSDLNFEEAELLEDTLDMSIESIGERLQSDKPKIRIIRAIKWLEMRRADPSVTFDDAKSIPLMSAFAAPKAEPAGGETKGTPSTRRSASSTGRSGRSSTAG